MTILQQAPEFAGKTAEQWKAEATDARRRSAESFARSDTDGALSQWASDSMARAYDYCAEVAEQGGTIVCQELFDLDGNMLDAHQFLNRYGKFTWVYDDAGGNPVYFNESMSLDEDRARANNAKKGYQFGYVRWQAALNRRTGQPFAAKELGPVEIVSIGEGEPA